MRRAAGWQTVRSRPLGRSDDSLLISWLTEVIINNKDGLSDEALAWQGGVIMVSLRHLSDWISGLI